MADGLKWGYKDPVKCNECRKRQKRKYYKARRFNGNKRAHWTLEDIQMVIEHKMTDTEIAQKIGRSGIRLTRLNQMTRA